MPQVTLYLPEPLLLRLKRDAKREKRSLSSVVAARLEPAKSLDAGWPAGFWERFHEPRDADAAMEVPSDAPPEPGPDL
jgi:hypothetical protein